jgi:hypothetical protein
MNYSHAGYMYLLLYICVHNIYILLYTVSLPLNLELSFLIEFVILLDVINIPVVYLNCSRLSFVGAGWKSDLKWNFTVCL